MFLPLYRSKAIQVQVEGTAVAPDNSPSFEDIMKRRAESGEAGVKKTKVEEPKGAVPKVAQPRAPVPEDPIVKQMHDLQQQLLGLQQKLV